MDKVIEITRKTFVLLCGAIALATLAWFCAFLWFGPRTLVPLGLDPTKSLLLDAVLCLVFAAQHSGMIRRRFKHWVEQRMAPWLHGPLYALVSGLALAALLGLWQTSDSAILALQGGWRLLPQVAFSLAMLGFVWGFFSLRGFDPLGMGQALDPARPPGPTPELVVQGAYRFVRHPLYSFTLVLLWANPDLTADRLLLNLVLTCWIVIGTRWEEQDLALEYGQPYLDYQASVPMLLPLPKGCRRRS